MSIVVKNNGGARCDLQEVGGEKKCPQEGSLDRDGKKTHQRSFLPH